MARAEVATQHVATGWLLGAALVFGCSVWSLHFVAMLAFMPRLSISYDLPLTAASVVAATGGALVALLTWRSRVMTVWLRPVVAGLCLGMAISGMHYVGVAAMRLPGDVQFDMGFVVMSLLISGAFGIVAMVRAHGLLHVGRRLEVTGWLAVAICSLHFTGMTAITIMPGFAEVAEGAVLGSTTLAFVVAAVSLLILISCLAATMIEQHLSQRMIDELRRMRLLSDLAYEVLFIHRDGVVLEVNEAGGRLLGMAPDRIVGRQVLTLFAEESAPSLIRRTRCLPEDLRPQEVQLCTATGAHIPVELSCRPIDFFGKPATAVALRDLTERKRDEARIRHLAHHDALTDLPNRFLLEERIGRALEAAEQDASGVAVVYLDLDHFKPVNDMFGHATGDALLVQVAKRLQGEIRPTDTLARVGGDEFVVVLVNAQQPERVSDIANRMIRELARPFQIGDDRVEIGVSVGIAVYPGDGDNGESLLRAADMALYRVKKEGRGALRFFEASMDAQVQARRQFEAELRLAVERDELTLFYQPIVNGESGDIETFEALIRWRHPDRGFVSPADFIPLAEQTNQIGRIGEWVINTACAAAAQWPKNWRVSVNVSPNQFRESDVPAIVAAALARNRLAPSRLVIEITEGVFIDDTANAVQVLSQLRDLGVRLALDDFGTGYSSLSYLQLFKFDKIKIDQSFVRKLDVDGHALTIIKAIVNLGHNLGLQVTVEGLETREQLAVLRSLGCEQMQGFLFGRPKPMETFSDLDEVRARAIMAGMPLRGQAYASGQ